MTRKLITLIAFGLLFGSVISFGNRANSTSGDKQQDYTYE